MHSNDFEEAFGNFLERREYDKAANALFSITRAAFQAGWLSAGGQPPMPQKLFELVQGKREAAEEDEEESEE